MAFEIPEAHRHDADNLAELFNTATDDLFSYAQQHGITSTPLTKRTLATCTLFRFLLTLQQPPKPIILRLGPPLRLLANFKSGLGCFLVVFGFLAVGVICRQGCGRTWFVGLPAVGFLCRRAVL